MMTRHEEDKLYHVAQELREQHADSPEYQQIAMRLEQAARLGDDLMAAEAASSLITYTLGGKAPFARRRFISG